MIKKSFFVNENKKEEVSKLRMQEYAKASGFDLDLATLEWKQSDDESFVMVAESDNLLLSTMRGEVIEDISVLEQKLECSWDFDLPLKFPVLLLSRAATVSSHRNVGLNLVLRYWFLKFAEHHKIPFVIGTFVTGSPRENSLRQMGYHFFENKLGWQQSTYRSLKPVNIVALDMQSDGMKACSYCREQAPQAIKDYHFSHDFPQLRFVKNL